MKGVIIENDREKESLTEFTNDEVSAYNDAYPETGLTAGDGEYLLLQWILFLLFAPLLNQVI